MTIRKIFRRPRTLRERGQTLALMALALPAIIGGMGIATDVGNLYFNHRKLQHAVDNSILSGAECLPTGAGCNGTCGSGSTTCTPTQTATYYTTVNGVLGTDSVTGPTVNGAQDQITMTVSRNVPYYFVRLVGVNSGTATVAATATAGELGTLTDITSSSSNLFPVGLQVCGDPSHVVASCPNAYVLGQTLTFNEKGTAPGNWDPVSFSGTSVSICPTGAGCITSNTGCANAKTNANNAQSRIASGLSKYSSATYLSHTLDDPRVIVVPLVDWTGINGKKSMNVYGFAAVWLNSTTIGSGCSTNPAINATFIEQTTPGGEVDTTSTAFNVGARAFKLIN